MHVSAVLKDSATYEHVKPETVGNRQRVLLSDLSGRGNVLYKLKQHGLAERLDAEARRQLLERIKQMEHQGYELEAAEGTFELLVREALHPGLESVRSGELRRHHAHDRRHHRHRDAAHPGQRPYRHRHRARPHECAGSVPAPMPVRRCIRTIANVRLTDYKVRVLEPKKGTAAQGARVGGMVGSHAQLGDGGRLG